MRIGIDARYLSHGLMNGIHTYLANLIPALIALASEDEIVLYADSKRPFELADLAKHVTVRTLPWRSPTDSVRNDLAFRSLTAEDRLDVMHFPANYGIASPPTATVITLHDALNIFPLWEATRRDLKRPKTVAKICYLQACTRYSLRHATMLMTVSQDAKRDILRHRLIPESMIVPVPHAPAPLFLSRQGAARLADVRMQLDLPDRFVLADAYKNPDVLIRAWERLPDAMRRAHHIVFFSRSADVRAGVQGAVARGEARLFVRPPQEDLAALYTLAAAFVFPSWIEGFGLPILEAMACGTPVIASDRHAIPEVAGGAALLMDAEDHVTLARHLERVLSDAAEADRLCRLGRVRAAEFSWARSAATVLGVYHAAAERARSAARPWAETEPAQGSAWRARG